MTPGTAMGERKSSPSARRPGNVPAPTAYPPSVPSTTTTGTTRSATRSE
ncbi:hypothetical protein [Cellulosimicrobium sp. CUA-896]|nr:hypothetical protein [Cellulosimicrobium sp. CUA-896]